MAVQRDLQILLVPVYQTGLYHPAHRQPVRQSRLRNHQRRIRDKGIYAGRLFRPHRNTAKRHDRRHQRKTARKDTRPGSKTNRQTASGQLAGHEEIPDTPPESIPPEYTIMYRPWREKYATPILILESLLVFTLLLGISYLIYIYTLGKRT